MDKDEERAHLLHAEVALNAAAGQVMIAAKYTQLATGNAGLKMRMDAINSSIESVRGMVQAEFEARKDK